MENVAAISFKSLKLSLCGPSRPEDARVVSSSQRPDNRAVFLIAAGSKTNASALPALLFRSSDTSATSDWYCQRLFTIVLKHVLQELSLFIESRAVSECGREAMSRAEDAIDCV